MVNFNISYHVIPMCTCTDYMCKCFIQIFGKILLCKYYKPYNTFYNAATWEHKFNTVDALRLIELNTC